MELVERKCVPCEGNVPKMEHNEIEKYNAQLQKPWEVVDDIKISRSFDFEDYPATVGFFNQVADLAQEEGHHPVMHVYFSKITIDLWTHAILGLSENDFILAAKINRLYENYKS